MEENNDRKSEEELIREVVSGDKKALAKLYELHFDALYKFVYSRCGSTSETEDIVSETWMLVIENISKYNHESKFRTFLFGFALNLLRRLYAKEKLSEYNDEIFVDEMESDESPGKTDNYIEKIKAILPRLKKNYKDVIEKRYFEEKSLKETARSMRTSVQNVKVIQNRAIKKIKELIN